MGTMVSHRLRQGDASQWLRFHWLLVSCLCSRLATPIGIRAGVLEEDGRCARLVEDRTAHPPWRFAAPDGVAEAACGFDAAWATAYHSALWRALRGEGRLPDDPSRLPPATDAASALADAGPCFVARAAARLHLAQLLLQPFAANSLLPGRAEMSMEVMSLLRAAEDDLSREAELHSGPGRPGLVPVEALVLETTWPIAELCNLLWRHLLPPSLRSTGASQTLPPPNRRTLPPPAPQRPDPQPVGCEGAAALARASPWGGTYLDVGAGACPCLESVVAARPDLRYVSQDFAGYTAPDAGVDNDAATTILKRGYCRGHLDITSDITAIPLPAGSVDAIFCNSVLEHVPEPVAAVAELARLLRPGGRLYMAVPFGGGLHNLPFHFYAGFTHRFFELYAERHGLTVENSTYVFTPWSTDALRSLNLAERWLPCLEKALGGQAGHLLAQVVPETIANLQECTAAPRLSQLPVGGDDGPSRVELEFPDAVVVILRRPVERKGCSTSV
eukprot:gnl/TRDRNA2_/TRDRNA2_40432_c0_seq1.p1 gnl/TRDRNA2_/TRDRNA2_40432_c0~~gnl/TRDRNA2_/TRDRNA2_40432_c0_seq1.p1  ORF type:complete len:502 (-),score=55.95 gnl/TRDRNA2_/TRDRNA2_40432_c0_seq1:48-1553(-)